MGAAAGLGGGGAGGSGSQSSGSFSEPAQPTTFNIPQEMRSTVSGLFGKPAQTSPRPDAQPSRGPTYVPGLDRFTTSSSSMSPIQRDFTQTSRDGQNQLNAGILSNVRQYMGNYGAMMDLANKSQTSQADIARAFNTAPGNVYTAMNRPDYKTYGPSGQFYQPIYQPSYNQYPGPSQFYSPGYNMPMMGNPFGYMYAEGGEVDYDDDGIAGLLK